MDNGRATTHEEAMAMLESFGLNIVVGEELATSADHQAALLTLVNLSRRTFLGGVRVINVPDAPSLTPLAPGRRLRDAVEELGGVHASDEQSRWPTAVIGTVTPASTAAAWQLTWDGWRGGVMPRGYEERLPEGSCIPIVPAMAAAACAGEVFAYYASDHVLAGRRTSGMSLWTPGSDWSVPDPSEPSVSFVPSRLWVIGLGNLGQAFAWLIALLPYSDLAKVELVLQDFDVIAPSNDSTSVLSWTRDVDEKKTRVVAAWLEERGFKTVLEERRFGAHTRRAEDEPGLALFGVDNANTRLSLDRAGFDLIVEAGLGAGPDAFRSISVHTFPGPRTPSEIWGRYDQSDNAQRATPAYDALKAAGMDECGLTLLKSRSVGVPFVGLTAGCLVIAELLRRLHGGAHLEQFSTSVLALENVEMTERERVPYAHGHQAVAAWQQVG
ncbi:MAG: thiamine biosynthesis protein ThiF [Phycisphaerales bacterium]|nr:thiamine biosynthesis protein ThiF [Phycisphaerales bacterium]